MTFMFSVCDEDQEMDDCVNQKTCDNVHEGYKSNITCRKGCKCSDPDLVMKDGKCVSIDHCNLCLYNDKYYLVSCSV